MYAIIAAGGKQYRVSQGDVIYVEKIDAEAGNDVTLDKVLFIGGEKTKTGKPYVAGATSWGSGWNWWEPNTLDKGLKQFSAAFSGFVPLTLGRRTSLDIVYGLYADAGEVLPRAFAGSLGIRFNIK